MNKRKRVGILLYTTRNDVITAHLQIRGLHDYRNDRPQTWPGICQVTVEGKMKTNETAPNGLRRELREELGTTAGEMVMMMLLNEGSLSDQILFQEEDAIIYGLEVPMDFFSTCGVRPEIITGGFRPVVKADLAIMVKAEESWRTSHHPFGVNNIVAMCHVIKALKKLFRATRSPRA